MTYWWVNQGKTAKQSEGFLWAPIGGTREPFWRNMERIEPGDIVLHYSDGAMFAISRARGTAQPYPRPPAWANEATSWGEIGNIVHLDQEKLSERVPFSEVFETGIVEARRHGPFTKANKVTQGYLFELTDDEGATLWELIQPHRAALPNRRLPLVTAGQAPQDMPDVHSGHFTGVLERDNAASARGEQAQLRKYLLGNLTEATCDICGRNLPASMLRAAHVVKRSALTDEERRRFSSIAFRACTLGCDTLFEDGYIAVSPGGITAARETTNPAVRESVARILGRPCTAHDALRAPYFARHLESQLQATQVDPAPVVGR